jgi:hypothetical protein
LTRLVLPALLLAGLLLTTLMLLTGFVLTAALLRIALLWVPLVLLAALPIVLLLVRHVGLNSILFWELLRTPKPWGQRTELTRVPDAAGPALRNKLKSLVKPRR